MKKFNYLKVALWMVLTFSCVKAPNNWIVPDISIPPEVKKFVDTTQTNVYDASLFLGSWEGVRLIREEYFDGELIKSNEINWGRIGRTIFFNPDGTTINGRWTYQYNTIIMLYPLSGPGVVCNIYEVVSVDNKRLIYRREDFPVGDIDSDLCTSDNEFVPYCKDKSGCHQFFVFEYKRQN